MGKKLYFTKPAGHWLESFPLGNGRIGAMVSGGTDCDEIWLNEDTFWSGTPRVNELPIQPKVYHEIRDLALQKKYPEAEKLFEEKMSFEDVNSYLPVGVLKILMSEESNSDTCEETDNSSYERELDLENAAASSCFIRKGGKNIRREAFVSAPDQLLVYRVAGEDQISEKIRVSFESPLPYEELENGPARENLFAVQAPSFVEPSFSHHLDNPIRFEENAEKRGMKAVLGIRLIREAEDSALLLIAVRTGYRDSRSLPDRSVSELRESVLQDLHAIDCFMKHPLNPVSTEVTYADGSLKDSQHLWNILRERHTADYRSYFDRSDFALVKEENKRSLEKRLKEFEQTGDDAGLYELLFHYGRYLMISGSRPGTQAMNLQGIWNREVRPPWCSDYTLNINTQMNYWPAAVCNLSDCLEPFATLTKELTEKGSLTAAHLYGAKGAVCHHNTDLWRITHPVGNHEKGCTGFAFWNMPLSWMALQLFESYRYSNDLNFLKQDVLPVMRESVRFLLDIAIQTDHGIIFGPSTSPENSYLLEGKKHCLQETTQMTMTLAKELFERYLDTVKLCEDQAKESDLTVKVKKTLENLMELPVVPGKAGSRISEWMNDFPEEDKNHRHISHLYGAYPGSSFCGDSEKMNEVRNSLLERGDEGTGWSLAWKVCQWARQGDGDHALRLLKNQLRPVEVNQTGDGAWKGGSYPNLFCAHPPFQIDGNFGAAAGIAEMLLQSDEKVIRILPAIPGEWKCGEYRGLVAVGKIVTDVKWNEHEIYCHFSADEEGVSRTIVFPDHRSVEINIRNDRELVMKEEGAVYGESMEADRK